MITVQFLITSLVVVLVPGTGVIYTVSSGLFWGKKASIAAALGCTAGIVPHLTACILGLSAILHAGALVFQAVKFAGAAYLFFLAWSMWRETGGLAVKFPEHGTGFRQIAVRGFLINILNPKLSIFFLAFLPQFVLPDAVSPVWQLLVLSAIFMAMTLIVFIVYGVSANAVRRYIVDSPRVVTWMQRSFAAAFALLGAKLAVSHE